MLAEVRTYNRGRHKSDGGDAVGRVMEVRSMQERKAEEPMAVTGDRRVLGEAHSCR